MPSVGNVHKQIQKRKIQVSNSMKKTNEKQGTLINETNDRSLTASTNTTKACLHTGQLTGLPKRAMQFTDEPGPCHPDSVKQCVCFGLQSIFPVATPVRVEMHLASSAGSSPVTDSNQNERNKLVDPPAKHNRLRHAACFCGKIQLSDTISAFFKRVLKKKTTQAEVKRNKSGYIFPRSSCIFPSLAMLHMRFRCAEAMHC